MLHRELLSNLETLVVKWRSQATAKEVEATRLDHYREAFTSKYYSSMTKEEQDKWNDLRDRAGNIRLERNVLNQCADELSKEIT